MMTLSPLKPIAMRMAVFYYLMLMIPFVARSQEQTHVPLAGNTWVTDAGNAKLKDAGLVDWTDTKTTIDTYIHFAAAGKVSVYLKGEVTGKSVVDISWNGKHSKMTLTAGSDKHLLGEWSVAGKGYVKLTVQGVSRSGDVFARPSAYILEGQGVAQASFVKDNKDNFFYWGRRGPSVHLNYPTDEKQIEWFYNEVTVPKGEDVTGSYFMANGFGEGYFGMQVNSETERRILFSVWSPFHTDDPKSIPKDQQIKLLKKGETVHTGEFGNEGSGGQSFLRYNWKAGNTYRFLLRGQPSADSTTTYTAYFFAPEVGRWQLIARFLRPHTQTHLARLHSFLENFQPTAGDKTRKVFFGNQWYRNTSGEWKELVNAKFTADNTARKGYRLDYAAGEEQGRFFLKNCGFFNETTPIGTNFTRTPLAKQPEIDLSKLP